MADEARISIGQSERYFYWSKGSLQVRKLNLANYLFFRIYSSCSNIRWNFAGGPDYRWWIRKKYWN
jgi:hypothetical protein